MAVSWLLITVVGLIINIANEISCQPEHEFANPPPLPTKGILLHINMEYDKPGNST